MECGAGGAVATDRSSIPLRTTTCVNLCEGITYGRRTRAHLRGFDRLRATSVAGRARGAGVATRVLFVCCRRVCDMASTFLFSFLVFFKVFFSQPLSAGRSFIVVGLPGRVEGAHLVDTREPKCRSVRKSKVALHGPSTEM